MSDAVNPSLPARAEGVRNPGRGLVSSALAGKGGVPIGLSAAEAAEWSVLGAILSAASYDLDAGFRVLDRVVATGLDPIDFYLPANGILFAVLAARRDIRLPLDPVSVAAELEQRGAEARVLGRLHRLAHEVTNFSSADHWAEIVVVEARRRRESVSRFGGGGLS